MRAGPSLASFLGGRTRNGTRMRFSRSEMVCSDSEEEEEEDDDDEALGGEGNGDDDARASRAPSPRTSGAPPYTRMAVEKRRGGGNVDGRMVPSYLLETCYAQRLLTRGEASARDTGGRTPRGKGTKAPASAGAVQQDASALLPLPSRWDPKDKCDLMEVIGGGLEIRFVGSNEGLEKDAGCARADKPMPRQCGIYYFEIKIISKGTKGHIGIGFCAKNVSIDRLPGWEIDSWGYHGDDGHSFCCQGQGKPYGPKFSTGDVIGCGVNFSTGMGFFTKNGIFLGNTFSNISGTLYPAVGMKTLGEHIQVNFGAKPFVYDIDGHIRHEKEKIYDRILRPPPTDSTGPRGATAESDVSQLLFKRMCGLVESYMSHNGFVKSGRAFRTELAAEARHSSTRSNGDVDMDMSSISEQNEADIVMRYEIRKCIVAGDIDSALGLLRQAFPGFEEANEQIAFKLKLHKFVELVRQTRDFTIGSEPNAQASTGMSRASGEAMDLDDSRTEDFPGVENGLNSHNMGNTDLLRNALEYGQSLHREYKGDPYVDALGEAFGLLAYTDPKTSAAGYLLDIAERQNLAELVNSAILVWQGKNPESQLERLAQQTTVIMERLGDLGVCEASFVNLHRDFLS